MKPIKIFFLVIFWLYTLYACMFFVLHEIILGWDGEMNLFEVITLFYGVAPAAVGFIIIIISSYISVVKFFQDASKLNRK